jgi:polar amino acid transport system substrate-binding protein
MPQSHLADCAGHRPVHRPRELHPLVGATPHVLAVNLTAQLLIDHGAPYVGHMVSTEVSDKLHRLPRIRDVVDHEHGAACDVGDVKDWRQHDRQLKPLIHLGVELDVDRDDIQQVECVRHRTRGNKTATRDRQDDVWTVATLHDIGCELASCLTERRPRKDLSFHVAQLIPAHRQPRTAASDIKSDDHPVRVWDGFLVGRLLAALLLVAGCNVEIPQDPDGTLDRVRGGVLRVGVSINPPWTVLANNGAPAGIEAQLVRRFADTVNAEVRWTVAGEESLVHQLEAGQLDLVIGGLTAKSPWMRQAAFTRPYAAAPGPSGESEQHVMAVPRGENAFLVTLERFLLMQEVPP